MPTMSQLDQQQVIKSVYDSVNQALQVNVVATAAAGASSVKITDGTNTAAVTAALALKVDGSAVTQPVSAASLPLPTGAATSANQSTEITALGTINTTLGSPMQSSGGTVTVTQATGTNLHTVIDSSALPTGAATNAELITINSTLGSPLQAGGSLTNISGTISLPTGASTSSLQTTGNVSLASIDSKLNSLGKLVGYTLGQFIRNDYTSTAVTTGAYVQLISSTSNAYEEFEIFDSSGQTLKIAFGASGLEVDQFLVFPGGNGRVLWHVPASTRISIEAVSANASIGELDLNLRG